MPCFLKEDMVGLKGFSASLVFVYHWIYVSPWVFVDVRVLNRYVSVAAGIK